MYLCSNYETVLLCFSRQFVNHRILEVDMHTFMHTYIIKVRSLDGSSKIIKSAISIKLSHHLANKAAEKST